MLEPAYAFDAFISYRRQEPDKSFARNLLQSLQAQGYRVAFDEITFSPQASFLEEMERCVRTSRFVLAVVSSRYFDSGNTQEEAIITKVMDMRDRKRRLIPLIFEEGIELPYWLYNLVGIHFTDPNPLVQHLDRLFNTLGEPTQVEQTNLIALDEVCPYQGLEAFTPETRQFFYGRQATVDLLLQKLTEFNFVPVIGVSGSGKSSVVRAGLMPSLGPDWQVLEPMKPDAEPMAELRQAMRSLFTRAADKNRVTELLNGPGLLPVLEMLPAVLKAGVQKVLLVIDQFEEVFTVCPIEDDRTRFIDCITAVQTLADSPLTIVTTMRADFVESWLDYGDLVQIIQHQAVWLERLQGKDLVQAIKQPAKDLGYTFGPGLLDLILDDVQAEKNCLPLLEFALTELWEKRNQRQKELPLAAYTEMQRLTGALNQRAEDVYNDALASDEERQWAKGICLELVRIGTEVKDTRQRQPRSTLLDMGKDPREREVINEVIEALMRGRLLVTTQEAEVDLAHEALMVGWQRFAEWRHQDRDHRRLVQRVRDAEKEWNAKEQDERYLLQRGLLAEVREQWGALQTELTPSTCRFYERSDEQEKEQIAFLERALAEAELREQALRVMNLIDVSPHEAAALAIQNTGNSYLKLQRKIIPPVYSGLRQVFSKVKERGQFLAHEYKLTEEGYPIDESNNVRSIAFSPNSQYIVSGSADCTLRLWDLQGNPVSKPFLGHEEEVCSVAFSPDGKTVVSASEDHSIRLWNLEGNPTSQPIYGHQGAVWTVAFSQVLVTCPRNFGSVFVSGGYDHTLRLWNLQGDPIGKPFEGHLGPVRSVAFSPIDQIIASASNDYTVRLWNFQGNPIGEPFKGHEDEVRSVAFSPDGKTIVSGGRDCTIRLWDLQGNSICEPFLGHRGLVWSVAFSPNGQCIVSSSCDNTIHLWNLQGKSICEPLKGHGYSYSGGIWSVVFSPDGEQIANGNSDGIVQLWDLKDDTINSPLCGHEDAVVSVDFSPNGQNIVSGSSDGVVQLWELRSNPTSTSFLGSGAKVKSVAFSPDSKIIASGSTDGRIRLWDLLGNLVGKPFDGQLLRILAVDFSPNGQYVVSGSGYDEEDTQPAFYDGTHLTSSEYVVQLWDLYGDSIVDPFLGHSGSIGAIAFNPDGTIIASGSNDQTIRLWDLKGNLIGKPFQSNGGLVSSVAFSPDGQTIVSGNSDKTIRLWDLYGNLIEPPFQGHTGGVSSVAFSPDGQTIVSGSSDQTIRLWDLHGNPIGEPLIGHSDSVRSVALSPDGQIIASSSDDCTIRLWRGGTWRDWLALCCNRFRYHPLFKNADREPFISACKVCEEYVWSLENSEVADGPMGDR